MSHWCHTMVDGVEFWFSCQQLRIPQKASPWKLIQNLAPSTMVWRQCDIKIAKYKNDWKECHLLFSEFSRGSCKNRNDQPAAMFYRNLVFQDTRFNGLVEVFWCLGTNLLLKSFHFGAQFFPILIVYPKLDYRL